MQKRSLIYALVITALVALTLMANAYLIAGGAMVQLTKTPTV